MSFSGIASHLYGWVPAGSARGLMASSCFPGPWSRPTHRLAAAGRSTFARGASRSMSRGTLRWQQD
eukprot:772441-Alexandrium_andersonii.AAC.1